mgnify:CR=1 FL=1
MKQLALTFFILLFLSGCITEDYVIFRPVYKEGDRLIVSEVSMSAEFKSNVRFVLEYYKVPYKEDKNGNIFIPENVWMDRDLIWNYTTKANDPSWLSSR